MLSSQITAKSFSQSQTTASSPTPTHLKEASQEGKVWPWWPHSGMMLISLAPGEPYSTRWVIPSLDSQELQHPAWRDEGHWKGIASQPRLVWEATETQIQGREEAKEEC